MRIRDSISNFLYQPAGYLDLMKRLSGLWLLGIMPLELLQVFNLFGPYHVPAWRIGPKFFCFPEPLAWISVLIWTLDFVACLMLVFGARHRFLPVFLFLVWLYYETLDRYIFHSSFVILLTVYLLAFAIEQKPRSLSRRLIQVALSSCYLFSALHKFHPEFIDGHTLHDILGRGFMLRPELQPLMIWLSLPEWFTHLTSWLVVFLEAFIGLGLWFRQTRKLAVWAGIFMHCLFTLMLPGIELFAPVAWTGYLAFFENRFSPCARDLSFKKPLVDMLVAATACIVCLALPARLFFVGRFEYIHMSLYDRVPWGFSMFLFHEEVKSTKVTYQTQDNVFHEIPLSGRMVSTSSDSDLAALAYYVEKTHPEAKLIRIETHLEINSRARMLKLLSYMPQQHKMSLRYNVTDGFRLRL